MYDPTRGIFKVPSKRERVAARAGAPLNPFKLLGLLSPMQTLLFISGYIAWSVDAIDFFSVSLNVSRMAIVYDKEESLITESITLTLLFRSVGALIFGAISDRYGRKWPLVINLIIISAFSLSTGFCKNFSSFLAVRSLFGIGMGGVWGLSASTALENAPAAARGLLSGILQQGYAFGYLLAAAVNLSPWMIHTNDWRNLFWVGAAISFFGALVRAALPESEVFLRAKAEAKANGDGQNEGESKTKRFFIEFKNMLKTHWAASVYGLLLMTGFNFLSHSSQDLYPTMIQKVKLAALPTVLASKKASEATITGNCGAIAGGLLAGYVSQYLGRRLTIVLFVIGCGALVPAWILPDTFSGLTAGAFFIQFCVQGAWGVVPIYLQETAPPSFRALWTGLAYQLGNAVSSASSQIEARGGDDIRIHNPKCPYNAEGVVMCSQATPPLSPTIPDYATVSAILLGATCAFLLVVVIFLGTENRGAHFENAGIATRRGAGKVEAHDLVEDAGDIRQTDDIEHVGDYRVGDKGSTSEKHEN